MERCPLCPKECKTRQAMVSHIRSQHPEFYSLENGYPDRPRNQQNSGTNEILEELLGAVTGLQDRVAQVESRVGESSELSERISDIQMMVADLVDRAEGEYEAPADGEARPALVAEPSKGFWASDAEMEEAFPGLLGCES